MPKDREEAEYRLRDYFAAELKEAARRVPDPPRLPERIREPFFERGRRTAVEHARNRAGTMDTIASVALAACLLAVAGSVFSDRASGPFATLVEEAQASGSLSELKQGAFSYAAWLVSAGLLERPHGER